MNNFEIAITFSLTTIRKIVSHTEDLGVYFTQQMKRHNQKTFHVEGIKRNFSLKVLKKYLS